MWDIVQSMNESSSCPILCVTVVQELTMSEALAAVNAVQSSEFNSGQPRRPLLFRLTGFYYVKIDNNVILVYSAGCFCEAVEFLLKVFYVFDLPYPHELKPVYGFFEQLMQLPVTIGFSAALSDFLRLL